MKVFVTLTTIFPPTPATLALVDRLANVSAQVIVAGDQKGPAEYKLDKTLFLSLEQQVSSPFKLARLLRTGHYCRKNVAYLEAMRQGATCIYETDDDNAPLPSWSPRREECGTMRYVETPPADAFPAGRWVNVYHYFTGEVIWPRGLPLDEIRKPVPHVCPSKGKDQIAVRAPIQQGLVNGSPDVDAVWRLTMDRPFAFDVRPSVWLAPGNWCPFNTQSTWWWPVAYPLLYIPSHCSFRMCDIWKSFVAQRCLWELGYGLVFHSPEVVQDRNHHDLMRDFRDEIPGYSGNRELAQVLAGADLSAGEQEVSANLLCCYEALVAHKFLPEAELPLVEAWIGDVAACREG